MPSRPDEPFRLEAIASIYAQTLAPARVIVVLNGPHAECVSARAGILEAFPGVEVVTSEVLGMAPALALGFDRVTTPYVAVLDADDLWSPEKQERQIARMEAEPALDAVYCEVANFSGGTDGSRAEGMVATARLFSCTTFRTDTFTRFGTPDPKASHFTWMFRWWSAAQAQGIVTVGLDYRGLWRRVHAGNGWVTDRAAGKEQLLGELRRIHRSRSTTG